MLLKSRYRYGYLHVDEIFWMQIFAYVKTCKKPDTDIRIGWIILDTGIRICRNPRTNLIRLPPCMYAV